MPLRPIFIDALCIIRLLSLGRSHLNFPNIYICYPLLRPPIALQLAFLFFFFSNGGSEDHSWFLMETQQLHRTAVATHMGMPQIPQHYSQWSTVCSHSFVHTVGLLALPSHIFRQYTSSTGAAIVPTCSTCMWSMHTTELKSFVAERYSTVACTFRALSKASCRALSQFETV